jgi:phospholipase C
MTKWSPFQSAMAALALAGTLVSLNGCGSSTSSTPPNPPAVTRQFLPGGVSGASYSATLKATGGVPPYSWSIASGVLPQGLTLNPSSGNISGTPNGAAGDSNFTAKVADSQMPPQSGSAPFSIPIAKAGSSPITHVVVVVQENRTPDNLFQDPVLIANGADIQNFGIDSSGNKITLAKVHLGMDYDPNHSHTSFNAMCDLQSSGQCKMDGADLIKVACAPGATDCPAPDLNFGYVDPNDVQPYFQLAEQYTFADRMFQTNQGPSFPAHQFLISGTSAPTADSNLFASENANGTLVQGSYQPIAGCDAVPDATVRLIDSTGNEKSNAPIYPCFEHPTLSDLLEANGIDWRYYTPGASGYGSPAIWNGPEAIQHICGPNQPPPNGTQCVGKDWSDHVVLDQSQVLTDIANGRLAPVSWVIPNGQDSDHSGNIPGNTGPSWVASIVNAIGASAYWDNTAIFITWDDWGGWYDHVAPPQVLINCSLWGCGFVYGFRVPLIVVSAFSRTAYISHQPHDFGSILKYIEVNFSLPSLGYADAAADDLSDCFIYTQGAHAFKPIQAPFKADFFLHDTRPPLPPDDD